MSEQLKELKATIRELRPVDLPQISEIEKSVYEDPWSETLLGDSLSAVMTHHLGIFQKQKPLAYAIFQVIFTEAHLLNLAVSKDFQGRGLGSLLLKRVLESSKSKGALSIYLEVRPSNIEAYRLYEHHGFRNLTTREKYYSNGESAIVMVLENL